MRLPLFRVDAFATRLFDGNPAAVCALTEWLADKTLQAIAAENNVSETAFFVPRDDHFDLRWFSPVCEVKLCGHATLATACVIFQAQELGLPNAGWPQSLDDGIRFETRGGALRVRKEAHLLAMDFPALPPWPCEHPPADLLNGLGSAPERVLQIKDNYFAVYRNEDQVRDLKPDLSLLARLHPAGMCITAPGTRADFVSRYFVPSYGIPEDPVTGSTHCSLLPYWADRLGKRQLHAQQLSARGGELWCEASADGVILKGRAILFLAGHLTF